MTGPAIDTAMIFAAGLGTRMGALTRTRPKPLIPVAGRTLIDRALALADAAGIARKVVNLHHMADMLERHLRPRADVLLSREPGDTPLETGGGLKHALPLLGAGPVFTLNPDAVFTGPNPFGTLQAAWQRGGGALLLLVPLSRATAHKGQGDFTIDGDGRLQRYHGRGEPLVNTGAQIIDARLAAEIPERRFSLNRIWDRLIAEGRLRGCLHPGGWADVGHPEGITAAESLLCHAENTPDV